jgi:hypothetical protein
MTCLFVLWLWYGVRGDGNEGIQSYRVQIGNWYVRKMRIHHNEHEHGTNAEMDKVSSWITGQDYLWRTRHGCIVDILHFSG